MVRSAVGNKQRKLETCSELMVIKTNSLSDEEHVMKDCDVTQQEELHSAPIGCWV